MLFEKIIEAKSKINNESNALEKLESLFDKEIYFYPKSVYEIRITLSITKIKLKSTKNFPNRHD